MSYFSEKTILGFLTKNDHPPEKARWVSFTGQDRAEKVAQSVDYTKMIKKTKKIFFSFLNYVLYFNRASINRPTNQLLT